MFESILIANRGEIACRILRTCRRLGIRSIAVHSDADADARHVREADVSVRIGPADAARSYLDADAIMRAALETGARAIHPGYGFLSESMQLVRLCDERGIAWIGPRAEVIARMGSKIESKRIAQRAGVPCVPGYHGDDQAPTRLQDMAEGIGVPLLIKASAGGGGKGMRRVDRLADFQAQLALARQEAQRAFGDDRVLLEKLIERPRHLEVQLAGDHHGRLVHLYERECSIQRNYQKVIEEAPAPNLPDGVRQKLFESALKLGNEIGYDSLGTVEFVFADGSDVPYFLEMNTRLQVEHPVTEMITGLDLVEWQIRIAAGEALPLAQEAITASGWAVEARINAEDPAQGFRPEFGTVGRYTEPDAALVRTDSGIATGSNIGPHYDSMVAKLIGFGATRAQAVGRLAAGLGAFEATGIGTNQHFLGAIVEHPLFRAGTLTTGFLSDAFGAGWKPPADAWVMARVAAALFALRAAPGEATRDPLDPWQRPSGFRRMAGAGRRSVARLRVACDGEEMTLGVARVGERWEVTTGDGVTVDCTAVWDAPDRVLVQARHGVARRFALTREGTSTIVNHRGDRWLVVVSSELDAVARVAARAVAGGSDISAEMPGAITEIRVQAGDTVEAGDVLVVMEAMKLIFPLAAPRAGTVAAVRCGLGDVVARGKTLVQLDPVATAPPTPRPADHVGLDP